MSSGDDSGIHFFRRIEEDTLRNGDLRIPRSFVSKYWEDISNPLLLLLPKGGEWKVKWKKIGVDIWLIDKWKKFVEFYSLDQDNLLIFKYLGMSQFEVVILDQSGLETVYPSMEANLDDAENGTCSCRFKKAESSLPGSHFSMKVEANNRRNHQPNISPDVENMRAQSQRFKADFHGTKPQTRGRKRKTFPCMKSSNSKGKPIPTESDTALERAKSFHSENHFFIRQMYPSYIQRSIMVMPGNIITKEEERGSDKVTLWTPEEDRHWLVHFYRNNSSGQISLSSGWSHFANDQNLQIGDVCVFEKIKKSGISFRVFIYNNDKQEPSSPKFSDYETPKCNNMEAENHFSVCINDKQLYAMKVPKIFFENHGIANSTEVILQLGERSWNVKLDPYYRFTKGWNDFMRECRLKGGDICVLELIDKKKIVFEVSILACIE